MMIDVKKVLAIVLILHVSLGASEFLIENKAIGIKVSQNYPNPCNSITTIRIDASKVKKTIKLTMNICDIRGRHVKTVDLGFAFGYFTRQIDVSDMSAGVYLCAIIAGNECIGSMKLVLIK